MSKPRVFVSPAIDVIEEAVREAGGIAGDAADADAIVWTDPRDPYGLKQVLETSRARWVQLPFAGIESFFEAGVIDPALTWTCAKGIYGHTTAEHALALMLMASRRLHVRARARAWERSTTERSLRGTTAVIVGGGGIARALISMLAPLDVRTVVVSRSGRRVEGADEVVTVDRLDDEAQRADWLVVAAALTPETRGLIGRATLARMKVDAWVVNVARGGLVDTDALVEAVRSRAIGGAALDVTDPEPLPDDHPLWSLDDVVITSHMANTTAMALPELCALVRRNVESFARGEELEGLVDPSLGY